MEKTDLTSLLMTRNLPTYDGNGSTTLATSIEGLFEGSLLTTKSSTQGPSAHHSPSPVALGGITPLISILSPRLMAITGRMLQELEMHVGKLLTLNPSRREAIAQYLDSLSGNAIGPNGIGINSDPAGGLRHWIQGPRSSHQNLALKTYFEEVALIALGQAIVLKSWADRKIRPWSLADLGRLNWALSSALKSQLPLDREGWQITKPNLYSWYNPGSSIQEEIWQALEALDVAEEGTALLVHILSSSRQAKPSFPEPRGYDARFFESIWGRLTSFGINFREVETPMRRCRNVFSPTLRDGAMVKTGPRHLTWIGTEASPYSLYIVELLQLWWGPACPPLWTTGTGLETHSREQLPLALNSPKPSLLNRISEMEACEMAFVLEERSVRTQGRGNESQRFKLQLENLPYFKKLRSSGTTLGALQACVALSKLRPQGLLWWAREEPLSNQDGTEILSFILDRGKILCEWNFADLTHSLPSSISLFPKYLYLISREIRLEDRLSHRPVRISLRGQIRSHIEIPLVLEDALSAYHQPGSNRGHWEVNLSKSPTTQKEWADRWPEPTCQATLRTLSEIKAVSLTLGSHATVKATPPGNPNRNNTWIMDPSLVGLWVYPEFSHADGRKLIVQTLPRENTPVQGSGFLLLLPSSDWEAPLQAYLESPIIRNWLDHNGERRGERWVLNEQVLRYLPVPKALLQALGSQSPEILSYRCPISSDWQTLLPQTVERPANLRNAFTKLPPGEEGIRIRFEILAKASQEQKRIQNVRANLFSMVRPDGSLRWDKLLQALPKSELVLLTLHSQVRMIGNLSSQVPIIKIDLVKAPSNAILFVTESGANLHLASDSSLLLDMIWSQVSGLIHPTWAEIVAFARLPRKLELAESMARDVLMVHGENAGRLRELRELIGICTAL
ncbi:MAG: hypothetical protein AABZ55_05570 [Bdellovibrionota bacterium]